MAGIPQVDLARGARCALAALDSDIPRLNAIIEEAALEGTVAVLIAALSSELAGNAAHFLGIEGAREAFDNVILNARLIDGADEAGSQLPGRRDERD